MSFDQEVIEQLRRSKDQIGPLLPVFKDQFGNIISGRHRKEADPSWPEQVLEVKDELDRELKIIHFNVQRKISKEETKERLLKIAKLLEESGTQKEQIAAKVANLVPYSERYVRELLPDEYKQIEFRHKEELVPPIGAKSEEIQPGPTAPIEPAPITKPEPVQPTKPEEAQTMVREALKRGKETKPYEDLVKEVEALRGRLEEIEYFLQSIAGEYDDNCPFCHKTICIKVNPDPGKGILNVSLVMFKR
jgi:DNA-directed RNA polymerase subunit F